MRSEPLPGWQDEHKAPDSLVSAPSKKTSWDTNHEGYRQIFCAALTGILSNPALFAGWGECANFYAVRWANEVVLAAIESDGALATQQNPEDNADAG